MASTEEPRTEDAPQPVQQEATAAKVQRKEGFGQYFRWRPLPWWVCYLLGIFLFLKLQLVYNDSPCAVLGTQSPVGIVDVKKAFRTLSMCTHPDRLRGRLGRSATAEEERRGEIIFNRASMAKDELTKVLKSSKVKKVACYSGEMELAAVAIMTELGGMLRQIGLADYFNFGKDMVWSLLSFKNGFLNTIFSGLWILFLFRMIKQAVVYFWRLGIMHFTVGVVTTIIIGPLPTVVHGLALPFVRLFAFLSEELGLTERELPAIAVAPAEAAPAEPAAEAAQGNDGITMNSSAAMPVAKEAARNLRQRKKKDTAEERERKNKELLTGAFSENHLAPAADPAHGAPPPPERLWKCVKRSHREPVKARQEAANAVQFDFLLITTKPVIPLFMLLALGQVWNGLMSSLLIGHALRRWVPQMSQEAHHLICSLFGALHTLLGVSAKQVEDYASNQQDKVLHLAWSMSFKDVLAIMHMCMLGSTMTSICSLGNEPSYAASFAAGLALRIAIAQDSIRGLGMISTLGRRVESSLRDLGIVLDATEDVVAYSGGGIGDCGGGPFRMLFGDGSGARAAALCLKVWLMLMPALSALIWLKRTVHAGRNLGKKFKTMRFFQRLALALLGLTQCFLLGRIELNASNGALDNFWIAMLIGCVIESLLATYDIRGPVRQLLFLVLFILI